MPNRDPWDLIDEPTPQGAAARQVARRVMLREAASGRVSIEVPPYVMNAPDWAARWGETAPPVGTVLRWRGVEVDSLARAALCTDDDTWNVTGMRDAQTFAQLARLIANLPCDVAVGWTSIPTVEARPAGDDAVKDWASQFLAPSNDPVVDPTPTEGH